MNFRPDPYSDHEDVDDKDGTLACYPYEIQTVVPRVSTGIPGYGLRTEMIRKFFPFPLWKRFRKSRIKLKPLRLM